VLQFRQKLDQAYTESSESELPEIKKSLFGEMKQVYGKIQQNGEGTRFYDWWFSLDLNNAHLSSIATYNRLVPAFKTALEKAGSYEGFYETVEVHAKLGKIERDAWLSSFE
jgi:predicted aminopeptidase